MNYGEISNFEWPEQKILGINIEITIVRDNPIMHVV